MKSECHKENGKLLIKRYNLSTPVEIARVRNEFYQRQEELQEKVMVIIVYLDYQIKITMNNL